MRIKSKFLELLGGVPAGTETEKKIKVVSKAKSFAETNFGLKFGDAYSEINGEDGIIYHLYASHPERIEVPNGFGTVYDFNGKNVYRPYEDFKGDHESAIDRKKELEREGYSTLLYVAAVNAGNTRYLSKRNLSYPLVQIIENVYHEGLHILLKDVLESIIPYAFEEASAEVIALNGTLKFAKDTKLVSINQALKSKTFNEKIIGLINEGITHVAVSNGRVDSSFLYEFYSRLKTLINNSDNPTIKDRFDYPVNTAYFVRNGAYTQEYPAINSLLGQTGDFKGLVGLISKLPDEHSRAKNLVNLVLSGRKNPTGRA